MWGRHSCLSNWWQVLRRRRTDKDVCPTPAIRLTLVDGWYYCRVVLLDGAIVCWNAGVVAWVHVFPESLDIRTTPSDGFL